MRVEPQLVAECLVCDNRACEKRSTSRLSVELIDDKTYWYRILDGPVSNPFLIHQSWRQHPTLEIAAMQSAAGAALIESMLTSGDRSVTPATAPASGLCLVSVEYK